MRQWVKPRNIATLNVIYHQKNLDNLFEIWA